jgi:integrase
LRGGINLICKKNDLPECGVHGLRRSFASLGFHLGLSELEVQEIGGWSDHNTVHKIYLKLAREDRLNAENKMERFYKNRGDDPAPDEEQLPDQTTRASA